MVSLRKLRNPEEPIEAGVAPLALDEGTGDIDQRLTGMGSPRDQTTAEKQGSITTTAPQTPVSPEPYQETTTDESHFGRTWPDFLHYSFQRVGWFSWVGIVALPYLAAISSGNLKTWTDFATVSAVATIFLVVAAVARWRQSRVASN